MTESSDPPPGRRDTPQGIPQGAPPYQYPYPSQYQPGQYPGGYPPQPQQPYHGYPPAPVQPRNGFGIASLVLAVVALLSVWSVFAGVILGLVAVAIGFLGRGRVKRGIANNGGVAIAGIVLGTLAVVVGLAFIAVWAMIWKEASGGDYISCMEKAGSNQVQQQQCADQFRQNVQDRLSVTLMPTPPP
jgi:hypothetical protein